MDGHHSTPTDLRSLRDNLYTQLDKLRIARFNSLDDNTRAEYERQIMHTKHVIWQIQNESHKIGQMR